MSTPKSITLTQLDDGSIEEAEKVVAWVRKFPGADAHIVREYIQLPAPDPSGALGVPGALRGVTIQWDHDDDGVADSAIHLPPGSTVTRDGVGFRIEETS